MGSVGTWSRVAVATVLLAACTSPGARPTGTEGASPSTAAVPAGAAPTTAAQTAATARTSLPDEVCPSGGGVAFADGLTATVVDIPGSDLRIRAAVYPHPDHEGNPWSQWGQGLATADGRFFSAIGDHLGADGNSYLYEFDPDTGVLAEIGDLRTLVGAEPGEWGHGKIHAQMVAGPCGEFYAAGYWGSRRGIDGYEGGSLLRIDPDRRMIENLGVPIPGHGIPSLASWPAGGLLYGEAADPGAETGSNTGPFFVYDVVSREVIYTFDDPSHTGFRSIAVDAAGRAYFGVGDGVLGVYEPETNDLGDTVNIPGEVLRAAATVGERVVAVSDRPAVFFTIGGDGTITELGPARGYTTSIAGTGPLYSVPGAHGDGYDMGTPVIALDPDSGSESVLVELAPLIEEALGLRLGGTYGVVQAGDRLFLSLNAGGPADRDPFGEVVLVEVTLP